MKFLGLEKAHNSAIIEKSNQFRSIINKILNFILIYKNRYNLKSAESRLNLRKSERIKDVIHSESSPQIKGILIL
jgi:hypothetical protein